jgi:hypothetical protein
MVFSGWYGNGTWAVFRRLMKYKIHCLGAGKKPNDQMCRAVAAMFPTHVDEDNVSMTRHEAFGSFFSKSLYANYRINTEASGMAAEIRSMAMAAYRYHKRHYGGESHGGDGDIVMRDGGGRNSGKPPIGDADVDEDADLLGFNSAGDDDDDDIDEDEDEDN